MYNGGFLYGKEEGGQQGKGQEKGLRVLQIGKYFFILSHYFLFIHFILFLRRALMVTLLKVENNRTGKTLYWRKTNNIIQKQK